MARYKVLRPFPYGDKNTSIGDTLEPEANDGRDWGLMGRTGYVRELHDADLLEAVTDDVIEKRAAQLIEERVAELLETRVNEAVKALAAANQIAYATTFHLKDGTSILTFRGALGELHDLEFGRVFDKTGSTILFDITAPPVEGPNDVASGTSEMSTEAPTGTPPVSEGSTGGTPSDGATPPVDTGKPLGGTQTGDSGGTDDRADGSSTDRPRAEVVEGEQGWFRVEAGGAKIGSSTRDRAEADRRAAEYNASK